MKKMKLKILFLFLLLVLPIVYSGGYMEFLTEGRANTLYCSLNTECTLLSLTVKNLTITNGSINYLNVTIINYNVTGEVNIEGNLNVDNASITNLITTNIQTTSINSSVYEDSSLVLDLKLNGNVNDSSQYQNHGTNFGVDLSKDVGEFDGVSDYVEVSDNDELSFTDGDDKPFSISAWIKPKVINTQLGIVSKYDSGQSEREYLAQISSGNKLLLTLTQNDDFNNRITILSGTTTTKNEWTFITFTYDGTESSSGMEIVIYCFTVTHFVLYIS